MVPYLYCICISYKKKYHLEWNFRVVTHKARITLQVIAIKLYKS